MPRAKTPARSRKAPRPPANSPAPPQVRRRRRSATVAVRKGTTLLQAEPRNREIPAVMKRRRQTR